MNASYLIIGMQGPWEWLILLFIVLILFGAGRLPKVMESMGTGIAKFKQSVKGEEEDEHEAPAKSEPAQESQSTPSSENSATAE
jgi:sec-independent protein translocase protein TatA